MNAAKRPDMRRWRRPGRHPTRRDGAAAAALFLLPWAVALVLVRRHLHLDVGTMVAVIFGLVSVSLGFPSLWLMWATYPGPRRSGTPVSGLRLPRWPTSWPSR